MSKRLFDLVCAALGLLLLSPLFLVLALWIKWDSPGPVFFRQTRVGRQGVPFAIHKFRSMRPDAEARGLQITVGADPRITRSGAFIRRYKLDELPQLIDVLVGDMSLVGPRPEVPRYVQYYSEEDQRIVLSVRPGITDLASIEFRDENGLLSGATDPEKTYVEEILPIKLARYRRYVSERSFWGDIATILKTLKLCLHL